MEPLLIEPDGTRSGTHEDKLSETDRVWLAEHKIGLGQNARATGGAGILPAASSPHRSPVVLPGQVV